MTFTTLEASEDNSLLFREHCNSSFHDRTEDSTINSAVEPLDKHVSSAAGFVGYWLLFWGLRASAA